MYSFLLKVGKFISLLQFMMLRMFSMMLLNIFSLNLFLLNIFQVELVSFRRMENMRIDLSQVNS